MTPTTFVTYRLSEGEKRRFAEWAEQEGLDRDALLSDLLLSAHKVSFGYDTKNACFMMTVTCRDPQSINHGLCCTSRAPNLNQAIDVGLFKHYEVFCDHCWADLQAANDWG